MNRLSFLKRLALGAAGLVIAPRLLAEEKQSKPYEIAVADTSGKTISAPIFAEKRNNKVSFFVTSKDGPGAIPVVIVLFDDPNSKCLAKLDHGDNGSGQGSLKTFWERPNTGGPIQINAFRVKSDDLRSVSFQIHDDRGWFMYCCPSCFKTPLDKHTNEVTALHHSFILYPTGKITTTINPGQTIEFESFEP